MRENIEYRFRQKTSKRRIPAAAYQQLCTRWLAAVTEDGAVDPHNPAAVARAMRCSGYSLLECQAEAVTDWLHERGIEPPALRVAASGTPSSDFEPKQPSPL